MTRFWTPDRLAQLRALRDSGLSLTAAAREMRTTVDAVGNALRRYALQDPAPAAVDPVKAHIDARTQRAAASDRQELLKRLADAEARNRFLDDLRGGDVPVVKPRELQSGQREGMAVALLSDAHIEEVVRPEAVSNRNAYNLDISRERMLRFFAAFKWQIEFHRQRWAVRDALLWLGGDLITGHIHDELIETNDCAPLDAVLELRGRLRGGIKSLLSDRKLERLIIPCNCGNHGRTTSKRRVKTLTENSYEWLLYNVLADDFVDDPRVTFVIPRSAHAYVKAYDFTLHFHHGDEVRYWGGVGGLSVPLGKRVPMWETVQPADYHHIGHFHQFRDFGDTIVNGSVIGYTEYAMGIGAAYEPPAQAFYLLDSRRGKTSVSPLWVGND